MELYDISYTYPDGTEALKNITAKIFSGESIAIAGPNGAGKSTLLLIMAGLLAPSSGEVKIFGRIIDGKMINDAKKMYEVRKRIGIVFQDPDVQLFSSTVHDDVAFGPIHLGMNMDEIESKVGDTLKFLGLEHVAEKHPYELSGGEKRKAAIATVLVSSPEVLLLDEPTADLDPKSRKEFVELLKKLKEGGKTIVIATHDMEVLPEIAERIIVIDREKVTEGPARDVLMDEKLLDKANLDVPVVARLFKMLESSGLNCDEIPFNTDSAIEIIKKLMKS